MVQCLSRMCFLLQNCIICVTLTVAVLLSDVVAVACSFNAGHGVAETMLAAQTRQGQCTG